MTAKRQMFFFLFAMMAAARFVVGCTPFFLVGKLIGCILSQEYHRKRQFCNRAEGEEGVSVAFIDTPSVGKHDAYAESSCFGIGSHARIDSTVFD